MTPRLYPFQVTGVQEVVTRFKGRCLLAWQMGLGKSAAALKVAEHYDAWPVVVVCPASLRLNWQIEARMWLPDLGEEDITVIRKSKDELTGKLIVISYDLAAKMALDISMLKPAMVVLDESTGIKNPKARRSVRLVPLCRLAPRCLLLSGTPILNRPIELYPQLKALGVDCGTFFAFAQRFAGAKRSKWGWDFTGASSLPELNSLLKRTCMSRLRKHEVLHDLPEKRRVRILLEGVGKNTSLEALARECRLALRLEDGDLAYARKRLRKKNAELSAEVFRAYHEVGQAKIPAVLEWILGNSSFDAPLVVFCHHQAVLDALQSGLEAEGRRMVRIDGKTSLDARQAAVEAFQAGNASVALLSITAAGTGITLTRASDMLIAELPFGPGVAEQAESRIHRIGARNAVLIRYLVAEGTIDELLWSLISRKSYIAGAAIDGEASSAFAGTDTEAVGGYWAAVDEVLRTVHEREFTRQLALGA